ncbi:hypothetical protein GX50_02578 [[Emmonsia] crescens]|uniref:Uncharacterized protein n=1 Tax=[Emmonsia] crescens TaxID=73230 RepID=A0A2B7ZLS8_9EURO|nr:hypothetical protein GX50_02578 [Emmonsia crescens]
MQGKGILRPNEAVFEPMLSIEDEKVKDTIDQLILSRILQVTIAGRWCLLATVNGNHLDSE